ncbi:8650_t:CDS:2, partial [Funneliformis mosseae]
KDILFELLKSEDLEIKEIVAWDCLIKWGIEQTPELESKKCDVATWNQEDFEAADFYDKVRPYKAIIPHNIYEEITLPKLSTLPPHCESLSNYNSDNENFPNDFIENILDDSESRIPKGKPPDTARFKGPL